MAKKYYWLKLKENFFTAKEIKKLRHIAGGDTYTVIYLKLMLLSLQDEGKLFFDGIEDTFSEELALELDEDPENVKVTLMYLQKLGLLVETNSAEAFLTQVPEAIGKETDKAGIMRRIRAERSLNGNNVTKALPERYTEIDIDIEKDIEIEKEIKDGGADFDRFWKAYPKKVGKKEARKAFDRAKKSVDAETMIEAVEAQKSSGQWTRDNGRYIPNPATWLNQGRWDDEIQAQDKPRPAKNAPSPEMSHNYDMAELARRAKE